MKIIDMSCPNCNAKMKVDIKNKKATCEHCGTEVLIDDEVQHVQYDNAEEAGYRFEKGRQRAQREGRPAQPSTSATPKKKNLIWLWVLGWICIFPIPLTILLLRKKDMKPALKYGIIAAAWLIYILIGIVGNNSNSDSTEVGTEVASTQTSTNQEIKEEQSVIYATDDIVNRFITEYNEQSAYAMTDITKGNIRTKFFGHTNDCYVQMLNIDNDISKLYGFEVTITGGKTEEETEKLYEVFPYVLRVLDPSATDEQIEKMIASFRAKDVNGSETIQFSDDIAIEFKQIANVTARVESTLTITSSKYGREDN